MESLDGQTISSMPVRKYMYQAQAPQTFNLKRLMELYSNLTEEDRKDFTDVTKGFFLQGEEVFMVPGDYTNMKITYPEDIEIAKQYLKGRGEKKNEYNRRNK